MCNWRAFFAYSDKTRIRRHVAPPAIATRDCHPRLPRPQHPPDGPKAQAWGAVPVRSGGLTRTQFDCMRQRSKASRSESWSESPPPRGHSDRWPGVARSHEYYSCQRNTLAGIRVCDGRKGARRNGEPQARACEVHAVRRGAEALQPWTMRFVQRVLRQAASDWR